MLQELRTLVKTTTSLVAEIDALFQKGDPAADLLKSLSARVNDIKTNVAATGGDLPEDLRTEIAKLLARFDTAVASGAAWLSKAEVTGVELAAEHLRQRVRRAYGVPKRTG